MKRTAKPRPSGSYTSCTATGTDTPINISRDLVALVTERMEDKVSEFADLHRQLIDVMAGRAAKRKHEDARRRLQNPMLRTTYVAERQRALIARRLELNEELARHLPPAVAAAVELEIVDVELAAVNAKVEELNAARPAKASTGLFPQAAAVVERLYEQHEIDRWHWASASEDELAEIAKVLRGTRA